MKALGVNLNRHETVKYLLVMLVVVGVFVGSSRARDRDVIARAEALQQASCRASQERTEVWFEFLEFVRDSRPDPKDYPAGSEQRREAVEANDTSREFDAVIRHKLSEVTATACDP